MSETNKNIRLNKPFRTPDGPKKYSVYVKNPSTGNTKKVNFGDPNMEIKRDNPERRKSFRARHGCDKAKDKTTPKYWSCKFWSTKSVSDLLKEIIEPQNVDITSIKFNETLNQLIWDENDNMLPEIRKQLLLNAKRFIEFSDLTELKFNDIILTGSLANYNYNNNSDFDIHIILNFSQISNNKEFVTEFLKLKKDLWENKLPIQIKNYDVELYFQDINEPHKSTGTFSLMKNEWINKPIKQIVHINVENIKQKASSIMNQIDSLENKCIHHYF